MVRHNINSIHVIAKLSQGGSPGQSCWANPKHEFSTICFPSDGGQGDPQAKPKKNAKTWPD